MEETQKNASRRTESVSFLYGIVHFSVKRTSLFTDKLRTYIAFAIRNWYILPEYKNVHKTYHFRIRFLIGLGHIKLTN